MKFSNCTTQQFISENREKRIIIFGAGQIFRIIEAGNLSQIADQVAYVIDNSGRQKAEVFGRTVPVYPPEKLKEETDCTVLITTYTYMIEMYEQLEALSLSDGVRCYIYPFMRICEDHAPSAAELSAITDTSRGEQIPRIIHSFWFSGDKKPDSYQRCIDTWSKYCPDYEIKEWNMENYDWHRHPFLQKAVEVGAWAYASDYARLDVVSRYGGIYMDMDVELQKPLDALLGNSAIFSFYEEGTIDLAAFGARKDHDLVKKLLTFYDGVDIPETKKGFEKYFQPIFVMDGFLQYGLRMTGELQQIGDSVFLPREMMLQKDGVVYDIPPEQEYSFSIHHGNVGWRPDDYATKKALRNRAFYNRLAGGERNFAALTW